MDSTRGNSSIVLPDLVIENAVLANQLNVLRR